MMQVKNEQTSRNSVAGLSLVKNIAVIRVSSLIVSPERSTFCLNVVSFNWA